MNKDNIYVSKEDINQCAGCGKIADLRMGHCFQCATIESIIVNGYDMMEIGLDDKIDNPAKTSLEKIKLLNQRYAISKLTK